MQVVPKSVSHLWETLHAWLNPEIPVPVENWPILASQQTRCSFVQWLAEQVAHDLLVNKPRNLAIKALVQAVGEGSASGLQQHAEHFLRNYYYIFPNTEEMHLCRMLVIFRHLVQKKLISTEVLK